MALLCLSVLYVHRNVDLIKFAKGKSGVSGRYNLSGVAVCVVCVEQIPFVLRVWIWP